MQVYEQVENYMKLIGLKYIKNANDFVAGLAYRTDRAYAKEMAEELNSRAEGAPHDNTGFYELKNRTLDGSLYVSAAFDGGVFRHIGNIIMDEKELFCGDVLDLCCDCGIVTCFMAQTYPETNFVGVDINESAVNNARELAKRLGITNAEFICADVYEMELNKRFALVTSFRSLLDAAEAQTKGLNFIGYRPEREETYKKAFAPFALAVDKHLDEDGSVLSVERYTAEYGWLGWMQALEEKGIYAQEKGGLMRAQDLSSVKEYSVTFAKRGEKTDSLEVFNSLLSKDFKSGTGYDGGMAEFALYYDSVGEIEFCDVLKNGRMSHQFAFAENEKGKGIYYDASNNDRKIKYFNMKKEEKMRKDFEDKLALYDTEIYEIKRYKK